jgi:pyridinium-3,5-bisthiocarboxylic acid mononucleotide nickel chelatase
VVIGVPGAERDLRGGDVTVVESTVDDLDPRLWPSVLHAVRAADAWDCWCTPIAGRHGRPGQVLTALCAEPVFSAMAAAIFARTGTLGLRWSRSPEARTACASGVCPAHRKTSSTTVSARHSPDVRYR